MGRTAVIAAGALLAAVLTAPAMAAVPPRDVRLLSGGHAQGVSGGATPVGMSADGSRALFTSGTALVTADQNNVADTYARDTDGTLQLIGLGHPSAISAPAGEHGSTFVGVSANGDRTWYSTVDQDVVADSDSSVDIYERRRDGSLREISTGNGAEDATFVGASDDGSHVLFATAESLLPADGDAAVDVYDRHADGTVHLVTPNTSLPVQFAPHSNLVSASGATLSFWTTESLAPDDTDAVADGYAASTINGAYTLLTPTTTSGVTSVMNRAGTLAWFATADPVDPADQDGSIDVYERRSDATVHLISGGSGANAAALVSALDDGSSVVFETTEKLLPADGDATSPDLYERRADGSLHLVSGGKPGGATFLGQNADGTVIFATAAALLPADTDAVTDVYARRHDGSLVLLTPGTAQAVSAAVPSPTGIEDVDVPRGTARTLVSLSSDLPGSGDTNHHDDIYEASVDGLRPIAAGAADGTFWAHGQSADGSRVLFSTVSSLATGDADTLSDAYEAAIARPAFAAAPAVTGPGRARATHTCKAPAIGSDGTPVLTMAWTRDGTPIEDATEATYETTTADAGHDLRCRITARNAIGSSTGDLAAARIAPAARSTRLTGFPIVGTRLTCTAFTGATSRALPLEAQRSHRPRPHGAQLQVGAADLGRRVTCSATARSGSSSATAALSRRIPSRCVVPMVRGLPAADAKTRSATSAAGRGSGGRAASASSPGLVLGTSPREGTRRPNGAAIVLRVRR